MLENRLEQLEGDLREDEETLRLLDSALQGGTFSNQMASVVRDVAKLLSETKNSQQVIYFIITYVFKKRNEKKIVKHLCGPGFRIIEGVVFYLNYTVVDRLVAIVIK